MKKSFEEIALDIVKTYTELRSKDSSWNPQYDYNINDVYAISNTVINIANNLAENYRARTLKWDEQNFTREVDKMLSTDEENV